MEEQVLSIIRDNIEEILPDIGDITVDHSLKELGANSIDRAEIIVNTMQELEIKISLIEFRDCKNIGDIIEIMEKEREKANAYE